MPAININRMYIQRDASSTNYRIFKFILPFYADNFDIEVQVNSEGGHVRRARFHSSMTDARMLREGQDFKELKDSYVIFIYDHDKFRKGLPFYHIQRRVDEMQFLIIKRKKGVVL